MLRSLASNPPQRLSSVVQRHCLTRASHIWLLCLLFRRASPVTRHIVLFVHAHVEHHSYAELQCTFVRQICEVFLCCSRSFFRISSCSPQQAVQRRCPTFLQQAVERRSKRCWRKRTVPLLKPCPELNAMTKCALSSNAETNEKAYAYCKIQMPIA